MKGSAHILMKPFVTMKNKDCLHTLQTIWFPCNGTGRRPHFDCRDFYRRHLNQVNIFLTYKKVRGKASLVKYLCVGLWLMTRGQVSKTRRQSYYGIIMLVMFIAKRKPHIAGGMLVNEQSQHAVVISQAGTREYQVQDPMWSCIIITLNQSSYHYCLMLQFFTRIWDAAPCMSPIKACTPHTNNATDF